MPDLHSELEHLLGVAVAEALGPEAGDADPLLRPAGNPQFGDYQANLAMSLGKQRGTNPRELAQLIVHRIPVNDLVDQAEVAGPGFINLTLTRTALERHVRRMLESQRLGVPRVDEPENVVIDYSSPNVAKEMHVGHLRSAVIGDCLARVLSFRGHRVIRQNHLGDWGTQFGMLIEHLADVGYEPGQLQGQSEAQIGDLNRLYQQAKEKFDTEPDFAKRARQRVVALQQGDTATLERWRDLVEESKRHFNAIYHRLGVLLRDDDIRGESFYNNHLADVVTALDDAKLLSESEGAKVVFLEGFKDRDGEPLPLLVQKSDGGYLYSTTDLAAARYRLRELGAQRVIYVTDLRQSQHFEMVFAALRTLSWAGEDVRLEHVGFGTMLGPDRKPFKTRQGETVRLVELLDEAESRAEQVIREKNPDLTENERKDIAHTVGIGALKYGDLSSDRVKDYVFDWSRMLALEGNTAPYLQNAYVRIRSIFRKGQLDADHVRPAAVRVTEPAERALALKLIQLPRVIDAVAESLQPHRLCNYLYELASLFHQFYEQCPVLTAEDEAVRDSRIALSHLVALTLTRGLDLLGIDVVEQM